MLVADEGEESQCGEGQEPQGLAGVGVDQVGEGEGLFDGLGDGFAGGHALGEVAALFLHGGGSYAGWVAAAWAASLASLSARRSEPMSQIWAMRSMSTGSLLGSGIGGLGFERPDTSAEVVEQVQDLLKLFQGRGDALRGLRVLDGKLDEEPEVLAGANGIESGG